MRTVAALALFVLLAVVYTDPHEGKKWYCKKDVDSNSGGTCLECSGQECKPSWKVYDDAAACMNKTQCKAAMAEGGSAKGGALLQPAKSETKPAAAKADGSAKAV